MDRGPLYHDNPCHLARVEFSARYAQSQLSASCLARFGVFLPACCSELVYEEQQPS